MYQKCKNLELVFILVGNTVGVNSIQPVDIKITSTSK